jgi:two-component system, OmpR family, response regulator
MRQRAADTPKEEQAFRVLIVDDNRDAANSLAVLARLWGCEVRAVYDGEAGLETARAFQPDCLLLDIALPRMDGYTLARRIRQQPELRRAKLVALSAYSSEEHRQRVQEAGFDHALVKPADPTELEGLLKMLKQAIKLAERTEALAQQNIELARETKTLLTEVKEEIQEVKEELREVKEELKDVKDTLGKDDSPAPTA